MLHHAAMRKPMLIALLIGLLIVLGLALAPLGSCDEPPEPLIKPYDPLL
jgi:hypothetical protein